MNIEANRRELGLEQGSDAGLVVPLILRGEVIESELVGHAMRGGSGQFLAPDLGKFIDRLPIKAAALQDLYTLSVDEIIDFLADVGASLSLDHNRHLRQAFEVSLRTSDLPETILESSYEGLPKAFERDKIERFVDLQIGRDYLEGWVKSDIGSGRTMSVRAFGARAVHIIAGNTPAVAFMTVLRSAVTRSDSIIKLPSNDPMPTVAILRTMIDAAPDHPVTRHLSAAYWKGGDEAIESRLYQPRHIEKIVAWGGYASVTHITKYLQPGIDLITLDPKHSGSIIGPEAFASAETMVEAASRAAMDIGAYNQEACANARVIYVVRDQDDPGQMAELHELGERIMAALVNLPDEVSTPAKAVNAQLQDELGGIELQDDFFKLIRRGKDNEGAVIVSQFDEAVEFSELLCNRTANLVPVRDVEEALRRINASSQTIGVYPDSLKEQIRDRLAIQGAQHIVSLGEVMGMGTYGPQDALETERRMLRWIRDVNGEPVPEDVKFTVESEPATVEHYRRDWLPHQYRGKPMGMGGMWLAGLVNDAEGNTYLAIRGVDDMAPGMVHAVVPSVGFRRLPKGDMSGEPPHLFAEWETEDDIDWFEPYEAIETTGRTVMSYQTGRIERDRHGCHWFDASNRWELHGQTISEVFTVHIPAQASVEGDLCYRHELLKATGQINGVPVEGYIHQDYAYAPAGKVWTETAIPRLIQGMWVSWVHEFEDGEVGGGCFWQGRKGLAFGPGYQVRNGVTTVHDDIVANPTFDADNNMVTLEVTIGGESYRFETESKSSRMHYVVRLVDSSLGRKPVKSWGWIEHSGSFMTGDHLDEMMRPFKIVRGI
jgi:hypothetical protein